MAFVEDGQHGIRLVGNHLHVCGGNGDRRASEGEKEKKKANPATHVRFDGSMWSRLATQSVESLQIMKTARWVAALGCLVVAAKR
jgi:hypothetical protein